MKKLLFVVVASLFVGAAISFSACGSKQAKNNAGGTTDSIVTDTTSYDSLQGVDSAKCGARLDSDEVAR